MAGINISTIRIFMLRASVVNCQHRFTWAGNSQPCGYKSGYIWKSR